MFKCESGSPQFSRVNRVFLPRPPAGPNSDVRRWGQINSGTDQHQYVCLRDQTISSTPETYLLDLFLLSAWDAAGGHRPSGNMSCSQFLPSLIGGRAYLSKLQKNSQRTGMCMHDNRAKSTTGSASNQAQPAGQSEGQGHRRRRRRRKGYANNQAKGHANESGVRAPHPPKKAAKTKSPAKADLPPKTATAATAARTER